MPSSKLKKRRKNNINIKTTKKQIMQQLVKITEQEGNQVVNARELHRFLESRQEFAHWIKKRIDEYGFIENEDFTTIDKIIKRKKGQRGASKITEYAISMDMAKELSMVERNDRGKEARRYFIAMEKAAKNIGVEQFDANQRLRLKQTELMELIKSNLLRGDAMSVSRENGFRYDTVRNVIRGLSFNRKIIKALFEKAKIRKAELGSDVEQMILELKN